MGLTLAALLGRYGFPSLVVEADESYCSGSRAICILRRSQEILGWVGADQAVVDKGLPWTGGRSHFRDAEVLHFRLPNQPTERFAPMVNLQQFYIEEFVHRCTLSTPGLVDVRWSSQVVAVRPWPRVPTALMSMCTAPTAPMSMCKALTAPATPCVLSGWWPATAGAARCANWWA